MSTLGVFFIVENRFFFFFFGGVQIYLFENHSYYTGLFETILLYADYLYLE